MAEDKKALAYGAWITGRRKITKKELAKKIVEKGYSPEACQYALEKLAEYGGVNDEEYAKAMVRSMAARGYGEMRIKQKLKEKGIERELAEEALEGFIPEKEPITRYITSKLREPNPSREMLKKVSDGLYRKGFSWEQINAALKGYLSDDEQD